MKAVPQEVRTTKNRDLIHIFSKYINTIPCRKITCGCFAPRYALLDWNDMHYLTGTNAP